MIVRLRRSDKYQVACPVCKTPGTASHPKPEATFLKGIHDRLRHRGVPTAVIKRSGF